MRGGLINLKGGGGKRLFIFLFVNIAHKHCEKKILFQSSSAPEGSRYSNQRGEDSKKKDNSAGGGG